MALSKAIGDNLDQAKPTQTTIPTRAVAPQSNRDKGQQSVSVRA
ncbi:MAG: hypothetical protein O2890_04285 [Cyanobacteria bacterium]|nr:hypothetical protein [Cyanobacteriota bacterium]